MKHNFEIEITKQDGSKESGFGSVTLITENREEAKNAYAKILETRMQKIQSYKNWKSFELK